MESLLQPLPLQTLSESGKPPVSRVASAADAQSIVQSLIEASRERDRYNARVKGMLDGNPPYDPGKKRAAGQAWECNINFLEGKAALSAALVPYYDLFAGATYYANVKVRTGNSDDDEKYSRVVTEEFDRLLKEYDGFDFNIQAMLHDFVAYGKGFVMWPDKTDWRFDHVSQFRVKVPDGAKCFTGKAEMICVRHKFPVHDLWAKIKNPKTARSIGWNTQAVASAIRCAFPDTSANEITGADYEYVQQRMKDRDMYEGIRSSTVQAAHLFIKEFSGKVTHLIVLESNVKTSPQVPGMQDAPQKTQFLFQKIGRFDKFSQAIATFFLETLDGSWNGASGIGKDIFAPMEIKNRLKCSAVNNTFLRSGIVLQARTANSLQKTSLIQAGSVTIIPPEYDVQTNQIFGDVESQLKMDENLRDMVSRNTGVYQQPTQKPQGNPRTLGEVQLQYQNNATLGNSAVNRFYLNLDRMFAEVFRRASGDQVGNDEGAKMAREFQKAVFDRGCPRDVFKKVRFVRAYRNMGNGSLFMRQQALQNMAQVFAALPESGKQNWVEDFVAVTTNQELVERYVPRPEEQNLPNDQQALAVLENGLLKIGAPVMWTPTQNNVIHAETHLLAGAEAAQSLEAGADPIEVAAYLDAIGQHTAVHLQYIGQDKNRGDQFRALEAEWKKLAQLADQLNAKIQQDQDARAQAESEMAEAQARAQSIESGQDPETQIKAAQARVDMNLKAMKTAEQLRQKQEKHAQNMAMADAKSAQSILASK